MFDLSYLLAKKISGDDGFHNMFSYQPGIYQLEIKGAIYL